MQLGLNGHRRVSIRSLERRKYVVIAGLLALISLSNRAAAGATDQPLANYFVSNSGSDSNSGDTPSTPWKTLAKLNATRLAPGSEIYLQCGSVFRETLEIGLPGSPSAPISYNAYGPCNGANLPRISGADRLTAWTAEHQGDVTIYSVVESIAPALVFEDNYRLSPASSLAAMKAGSYFYDAGRKLLYVRTKEDGLPSTHSIEASVRENDVVIKGVSYINLTQIVADKAMKNDILAWGSLSHVNLTATVTNDSAGNGIWFSSTRGQFQNDVLIKNCIASYNGENGIMKGNAGNNFVIQDCTTNYNSFDERFQYTSGIRFVSEEAGDERPTNSGALGNTAAFNGIDPQTGDLRTSSAGQEGTGVWCDTCGDGSFLKNNIAHDNAQNGVMLEYSGREGTRAMTGNIAYRNRSAGILHSRRSHNDVVSNNTSYNNQVNCQFTGEYNGGETAIGMVNNTYENNICASQVLSPKGTVVMIAWGTENNAKGEGSDNVFRNNSFGVPSATNGAFATIGAGRIVRSYAELDAAYGASMHSMRSDPMLINPGAGNFALRPGSPAIKAGVDGVDLGALPFVH